MSELSLPSLTGPKRPDYCLPVGSNARPGRGWLLVDYSWDEDSGAGQLTYRRKLNPSERLVVEVQQPASKQHAGWRDKPEINREAMLARYFDSTRTQIRMQAAGVYGR